MKVDIHPHARERLAERGATEPEVIATVEGGEQFPAKFGRFGFRRNFTFDEEWRGRRYGSKQVEAWKPIPVSGSASRAFIPALSILNIHISMTEV